MYCRLYCPMYSFRMYPRRWVFAFQMLCRLHLLRTPTLKLMRTWVYCRLYCPMYWPRMSSRRWVFVFQMLCGLHLLRVPSLKLARTWVHCRLYCPQCWPRMSSRGTVFVFQMSWGYHLRAPILKLARAWEYWGNILSRLEFWHHRTRRYFAIRSATRRKARCLTMSRPSTSTTYRMSPPGCVLHSRLVGCHRDGSGVGGGDAGYLLIDQR